MRFLLDVHIANAIARALEAEGHDVVRAAVAHATWSDPDLLTLAVREDRIIVTEDSDFSDLIYAVGMPRPLPSSTFAASRKCSLQWSVV
ncbi:MAG TPA: DUF5615 family PIN-like protein [Allosphingosinicella sp.]